MKGDGKCGKCGGFGSLGPGGHSRSLVIAPFNRAHTIRYDIFTYDQKMTISPAYSLAHGTVTKN